MKLVRNLFLISCLVVMALTVMASPAFAWTITASVTGAGGSISPAGAVTVAPGASQAFSMVPIATYHVLDVLVDGVSVGHPTSYTFANVTADHTIDVTFDNHVTITAISGAHGTVTPAGVTTKVYGENETYTITPAAGYQIDSLFVNGLSVPVTTPTVGMTHTLTNVTANSTIAATFVFTCTITASAGANGAILPLGVVLVAEGYDTAFTVTPIAGYHVASLTVDGAPVPAAVGTYPYPTSYVYTFTDVSGTVGNPHTIAATFAINTYTITSTQFPVDGSQGTIAPLGVTTLNWHTNQIYTISPAATYVARVLRNGVEDTSLAVGFPDTRTYTFSNVALNHTIAVSFDAGTPVITAIGPKSGFARSVISFQVSATDPGNHDVTWSIDAPSIAKGMTVGQGAGANRMKGNFSWTPWRDQIGDHTVEFTVADAAGNHVHESVVITVKCNPATIPDSSLTFPLGQRASRTIVAGMPNTFLVEGFSIDTADVDFIETGDTTTAYRLPAGASITNQANPGVDRMRAEFAWGPLAAAVGTYHVRFTAADSCSWVGAPPNTPADTVFSRPVTLNVILANPIITVPASTAISAISALATDTITAVGNTWQGFGFRLYARDPVREATTPPTGDVVWTIDPAFPAPAWAALTDSGGASLGASFNGIPACSDAGVDTVGFIATDPVGVALGPLADTIMMIITVLPGNPFVTFNGGADSTIDVLTTKPFNFTLTATDPNTPNDVIWTVDPATPLPTGAVFTDLGALSKNATFAWTPTITQFGVDSLAFIATDNSGIPGCADTSRVTIVVSSTRMLAVPFDTIPKTKIDVPLLKFKIGAGGYTLTSLKIRSKIQKEFAISKLSLWKNNATTPFATAPITGRFDDNIEKTLSGLSILLDTDDTITVKVDTWPEKIDADTAYHMTGLELVIPPNGMVFQRPSLPDVTLFPYFICNTAAIDSMTGNWRGVPNYRVRFDISGPHFSIDVTDIDACVATNYIHVGSKLAIHIYGLDERVPDSSIYVDLRAFGITTNPYRLKNDNPLTPGLRHFYNPNWLSSTAYLAQAWYDTITVAEDNLDFDTGYKITFKAKDRALNEGMNDTTFTRRIDTINPKVDSLKLFVSVNSVDGDSSATFGDELTLIAYLGSSGFFEVKSVAADLSKFGDTTIALEDITNGNNVWRGRFILKNPPLTGAVDIPWGLDSLRKSIIITALDSACNFTLDTAYLRNALDLDRPVPLNKYWTLRDSDSSNATNIGDSVFVRVDLKGHADIAKVWADFKEAGLGGLKIQPLFDNGTNNDSVSADTIWSLGWRIGKQMDVALDPNPEDAKDVNSAPIDGDYRVRIYVQDDAGIVDTSWTPVLTRPQGGAALLDTRRPTEINHNFVQIKQLAAGKIRLIWPRKLYAQAEDARQFYVFVDSTDGSAFNYGRSGIFGTTYDGEYEAEPGAGDTLNAWTSEVLTSNKTYRFVIRTKDDGGNYDLNTTPYVGVADGQAPWACVAYPAPADTGKYWGTENPLIVTATTTFTDLDAAWIYYRNTNIGGGIVGEWTRYTPNMSIAAGGLVLRDTITLPQLAQYKGHYELYIIGQDKAGNILDTTAAKANCPAFTFFWEPQTIQPDFLAINGSLSPQSTCGFNVKHDSLNTAKVTVVGGDITAAVFTIDSWVIFNWGAGQRDSTRIEYADTQKVPFTYSFSVNDWPKTGDGITTDLYVRITNIRNGASGIAMVTLCVPDVAAPDIRMTLPKEYTRVAIAKSSLPSGKVELRAAITPNTYDPDNPVRCEFWYSTNHFDTDSVKIGETGDYGAGYFKVYWNNSDTTKFHDGDAIWLRAIVHDQVNNVKASPAIKVFLDAYAPLMTLTVPQSIDFGGATHLSSAIGRTTVDLTATITGEIDVKKVEFFISYRDSVDLVKYYHKIGEGGVANNNSIWTYQWNMNAPGWLTTDANHPVAWLKCGYDYKLRIKVTDIANNVYDDGDGDGQFDDYTFWLKPWEEPINLNDVKDQSKMLFTLDCGAPQVAIKEFTAGGRSTVNPSTLLNGSGIVYAKNGEAMTVKSLVFDTPTNLSGIARVEYQFYSPVVDGYWIMVGSSTDSVGDFSLTFDPFNSGKALIRQSDFQNDEYHSYIKAIAYDNLGQKSEDVIDCWILDNIGPDPKWRLPKDNYVWGEVDLQIWALNADTYKKVTYKVQSGTDWIDIATVWSTEAGALPNFPAVWHTFPLADGPYVLGIEVTDWNDNVKTAVENQKNYVTVHNALPTATITSPADGAFFCETTTFKATADSPIDGVRSVDFQYKAVTAGEGAWLVVPASTPPLYGFIGPPDNAAPWEKQFTAGTLPEGFYHFRAVVTNMTGRTAYSPVITMFLDKTPPRTYLKTITDGTTTWDMEAQESGTVKVDQGTKLLSIDGCAWDDDSPLGSQPIYNSGMGYITLEYVAEDDAPETAPRMVFDSILVNTGGCHTFRWDISALSVGDYTIYFTAYDEVGCNYTQVSFDLYVEDVTPPISYIAGFYEDSLYGFVETESGPQASSGAAGSVLTGNGTTVQFQWSTDNGTSWIPIGISKDPVATRDLPDDRDTITYGLYAVGWKPVANTYKVRMIAVDAAGNPSVGVSAPPVTMQIANGVATVTSNAADFGPASIQKTLEGQPQDGVEGYGRINTNSSYGMPFGVAIGHNLLNYAWSYDIIDLRKISQQSNPVKFGGPFNVDALVDGGGGYGWGEVFFFGASADLATGFSQNAHLDGWWIRRSDGTGGPVYNEDSSVTVTVPQSWSPSILGDENLLVISESELPAAAVCEDRLFRPVGNDHGMAYFIGNLGYWSEITGTPPVTHYYNWCSADDDNRYVTIKMKYNSQIDLPAESLRVLWYDENDGAWKSGGINFPIQLPGVGFNTTEHTVTFATRCMSGPFTVAVPIPPIGFDDLTLWSLEPSTSVNSQIYTQGYPKFRYQVPQIFRNVINWDMLEIKIDGTPIWTGTGLTGGGIYADGWYVNIDPVSGQVHFWMKPFVRDDNTDDGSVYDEVEDMLPPLACGEHTIYVGVLDDQSNLHYTSAAASKIMVDCKPPHVTFPNSYVSKNPTIEFEIADDVVGVNWDSVFVDVYFVDQCDTAAGGENCYELNLQTTFSPDQIRDYRVGANGVKITTHYELHDERAILVVVYDGWRHAVPTLYPFDFYAYYFNTEGVLDLVGNHIQPSMQFLSVDYEGPVISLNPNSGNCPMVFRISDDGSGFTEGDIEIRENGIALSGGKQSSVSAVNSGGKWFFSPSGDGGLLSYCPNVGVLYQILVTDGVGNTGSYTSTGDLPPIADGDLTVTMSNNPFDPTVEPLTLRITLKKSATVTAKIYDMGGDLVRTLNPMVGGNLFWDGKTEGGTTIVANGVYLAYIVAEGGGGSISTVVKIAVVKK